jgi:glycosyltransferase involved in cell wall biosynthesis
MSQVKIKTASDESGQSVPSVSVVMPLFNKLPHVRRSISSVLSQSFGDFELIIVNDASTDGSVAEVLRFEDPRIRLAHRDIPGAGGYAARNLGVELARADWVSFIDADDEWEPIHLERVYDAIRRNPAVSLISCGWKISEGPGKIRFDPFFEKHKASGLWFYSMENYFDDAAPLWTSVATIRRDLLVRSGGFQTGWRHGGDLELWARLLLDYRASGLWQPYVGATYHKDSVNMVTKGKSQVYSARTVTIKRFLLQNEGIDRGLAKKLGRVVNGTVPVLLERKIAQGGSDLRYLKEVSVWGAMAWSERLIYWTLARIPVAGQRLLLYLFRSRWVRRVLKPRSVRDVEHIRFL